MFNKYWFKPKKYGYGSFPVTWEGWITVLVFVFLVLVITLVVTPSRIMFYLMAFALVMLFIIITHRKTKGELKWRWGGK